jgi:hypothetical protein
MRHYLMLTILFTFTFHPQIPIRSITSILSLSGDSSGGYGYGYGYGYGHGYLPLMAAAQCVGNISQSEYFALEDLYMSASGWNWRWDPLLSNSTVWSFPSLYAAPCSEYWQGLHCGNSTTNSSMCSITELQLRLRDMVGVLPSSIGQLTSLTAVNISSNKLSGSLPTELGYLTNLQWLDVSDNHFALQIPSEIGEMIDLEVLYLSLNSITGSLPAELGQLSQLLFLNVGYNSIGGTLPLPYTI